MTQKISDERLAYLIECAESEPHMGKGPADGCGQCEHNRDTASALRELQRTRQRESPHCPSCSCGEPILGPLTNAPAQVKV